LKLGGYTFLIHPEDGLQQPINI